MVFLGNGIPCIIRSVIVHFVVIIWGWLPIQSLFLGPSPLLWRPTFLHAPPNSRSMPMLHNKLGSLLRLGRWGGMVCGYLGIATLALIIELSTIVATWKRYLAFVNKTGIIICAECHNLPYPLMLHSSVWFVWMSISTTKVNGFYNFVMITSKDQKLTLRSCVTVISLSSLYKGVWKGFLDEHVWLKCKFTRCCV